MSDTTLPPALVLLPGMDGTGLMFGPILPFLEGLDPRVVRYPAELTSYPDCLAFARAQLPLDRPFLLLGESFSGPIAIALAAERPEGLQGLVLCVTFARNPSPGLACYSLTTLSFAGLASGVSAPGSSRIPAAARTLFSISKARSGFSFRNSRALSLPWPIFSPL